MTNPNHQDPAWAAEAVSTARSAAPEPPGAPSPGSSPDNPLTMVPGMEFPPGTRVVYVRPPTAPPHPAAAIPVGDAPPEAQASQPPKPPADPSGTDRFLPWVVGAGITGVALMLIVTAVNLVGGSGLEGALTSCGVATQSLSDDGRAFRGSGAMRYTVGFGDGVFLPTDSFWCVMEQLDITDAARTQIASTTIYDGWQRTGWEGVQVQWKWAGSDTIEVTIDVDA